MRKKLEELENNEMNSVNIIDVVGRVAGCHGLFGVDNCIVIMTEDNSVGNKVVQITNKLRGINDKKVTTLRLSNNTIEPQDSANIVNALCNSRIERLELNENNIGDVAATDLMSNLQDTHITHLRIKDYTLDEKKKFPVHTILNAKNITSLEIKMENVKAQDFVEILANLKSNLTYLSVYKITTGWNKIVDFEDALQDSSLTTLCLGIKIGDNGIRALANSLPGSNIKTLDLSNNNISDKGAEALANILPKTNIKSLVLNTNKIKEKAKDLVSLCVNGNLESLYLRFNKIADQEAEDIAFILKTVNESHTILSENDYNKKHIDLRDNEIGYDGIKAIISVFNKIDTTHEWVEYYKLWSYLDKLENDHVHIMVDMYEVHSPNISSATLSIDGYSDDMFSCLPPVPSVLY